MDNKNNVALFSRVLSYIKYKWETFHKKNQDYMRSLTINKKNRKRLKNTEFSVISDNCNGGTICHDLGLRFNSQFVNLWMYPADYIEYLKHFDYYNEQPLEFVDETGGGITYPVGSVGGLKIYFMHYLSEEEAREKWEARKSRIVRDNIFVMMTDRENCSKELMEEFDKLPFEHKVVFVHKPIDDIKSAYYITGFENDASVGRLNSYISYWSVKKHYDKFDYVSWFNGQDIQGKNLTR